MRFNKPIKGFTYKDNQSNLNIIILFFQNTLKKAQKRRTANILKKIFPNFSTREYFKLTQNTNFILIQIPSHPLIWYYLQNYRTLGMSIDQK